MYRTLPSGARLVVDPVPSSPVAAVYVWLGVGSADEGDGEHGAAHFVEHMLFKGTERRGVGAVVEGIEARGGDVNAWTSLDETVYHATVPAPAWDEALDTLLDMVLGSRFDAEEVENERGVILEEIRGGRDEPERLLGEAIQAAAWGQHPYGRPVIGTSESVTAMSRETLVAFWRRWYTPGNLLITISGGVDPDAVAARVEALLGAVPAAAPSRAARPAPPAPERRVIVLEEDFEEPLVELVFPSVPIGHPDEAALEVLGEVLAGGTSSALHRALKVEGQLVTSSWAALDAERDGGAFLVGFSARKGCSEAALKALVTTLSEVAGGKVSSASLRRAREGLRAGRLFDQESVDGRASDRARSVIIFNDPSAGEAFARSLAAVDAAAVKAVAARTLDFARCTIGALVRPGELDAARIEAALTPPVPAAATPAPPIVRRVIGGMTVVVETDPDKPVVAMRLVGLGGQLTERRGSAGRASAWARGVVGGAGSRSYAELSDAVTDRGGSVGGFSGMNTQGLRADFPADAFEDGLALMAEVARSPRFEQTHVDRVLAEQRESQRIRVDDPAGLAWDKALRLLYGEHPYGLLGLGTAGSLARVSRASLVRLHRRVMTRGNLVLSVVGPVDPEAVFASAERLFGVLPDGPALLAPRLAPPPPREQRVRMSTSREQAHLVIGWPGARLIDPDGAALELACEILGRQGGRLFRAVREERGLAYAVSMSNSPAWDGGVLGIYVGCEGERVEEAREAALAEVQALALTPPSAEELAAAKELAAGLAAMDRQRAGSRAIELAIWERYGVRGDRLREWEAERRAAVTAEEVSLALASKMVGRVEVQMLPG